MNTNTLNNAGALSGRILLGLMFVSAGVDKIGGYAGTQGYMESMGVPGGVLPLVIALEIGAGLAVMLGILARISALALAGFTLVAAVVFHAEHPVLEERSDRRRLSDGCSPWPRYLDIAETARQSTRTCDHWLIGNPAEFCMKEPEHRRVGETIARTDAYAPAPPDHTQLTILNNQITEHRTNPRSYR